jgi:sugar phosphate permease
VAQATVDTGKENLALSWNQRTWRWRILIATYFAYVGYYLTRKVFTIVMKPLSEDFNWDLHKVAHIWTVYLVAYMLGQFICSFVGRKYGPRLLLLGGLGLSIVFNVIFGFTNSYATFMVFMFFNGLVQASGWAGSVGGVAHWLRAHERGTIMGVWSTSYLIGQMLMKSLGGLLLGYYGWRWSFWGCTLVSFGIWWLIYFWQRTKPQDVGLEPIVGDVEQAGTSVEASNEEHVSLAEYLRIAFNPIIISMGLAYFCIKFMRYALDLWLPAFLNIQGFSAEKAALSSQTFEVAGFFGVLLAGWALDRLFKGPSSASSWASAWSSVTSP